MTHSPLQDGFLPGLPTDLIREAYKNAPGKEIESGKFLSPESSSALAANTFGFFLESPEQLPLLPNEEDHGWPPRKIKLEGEVRFPWSGGLHPWLDILIETSSSIIGVESKRYEPYRSKKKPELSDAYWRPVWGAP